MRLRRQRGLGDAIGALHLARDVLLDPGVRLDENLRTLLGVELDALFILVMRDADDDDELRTLTERKARVTRRILAHLADPAGYGDETPPSG